jgi:hypothetical protein
MEGMEGYTNWKIKISTKFQTRQGRRKIINWLIEIVAMRDEGEKGEILNPPSRFFLCHEG